MNEVHSQGACSSHREEPRSWSDGGGWGYAYVVHLAHPCHTPHLSFLSPSSPHFFSSPTPPLTPLPRRGRDGGEAWKKQGVAAPRQGRTPPGLLGGRVAWRGCLTQNVDFRWLQAAPGPDSCTVAFLSSRAIHWYLSQDLEPQGCCSSLRRVQGGLVISFLLFPSFSFPFLSPFSSFPFPPPPSSFSSPLPAPHSHATMCHNKQPSCACPLPTPRR